MWSRNPTRARAAATALRRRRLNAQLDRFADLLAEGMPPKEAAVRLGAHPNTGNKWLREICERLGPQAR
jgi:transposase